MSELTFELGGRAVSASSAMAAYAQYVMLLRSTTQSVRAGRLSPDDPLVSACLNGQAASELRRLVPAAERRKSGAFFTGSELRTRFTEAVRQYGFAPFFDAACGAGDLLLSAAECLDADDGPVGTLTAWSAAIQGRDSSSHFASAARWRLQLAALARHGHGETTLGRSYFRGVSVGDGTRATALIQKPGTLLINPPFGKQLAPKNCTWGSGSVPRAGVFFQSAVRNVAVGSKVIAILPDVLRSGSSLAKFRTAIEQLIDIEETVQIGQFDSWTDIDVFMLIGTRRSAGSERAERVGPRGLDQWMVPARLDGVDRLDDFFEVRVGPVVQNRDPMIGPERPFLMAHELPRFGTITGAKQSRRFAGTVFEPPFVAVRRTDRPSRFGPRAVAVTVDGTAPFAVENHLLVLRPLDGRLETCQEAADWLAGAEVRSYLDSRINCRHLTTEALREAPAPVHWVDRKAIMANRPQTSARG